MRRPYTRLLRPAVFILLTVVAPVSGQAAPDACGALFSDASAALPTGLGRIQIGSSFQQHLRNLHTPDDFRALIHELVQAEGSLSKESRLALMKTTLIPTLRELRASAPDSPVWQEIADFVESARSADRGSSENFKKVATWLEPVLLEIRPETLFRFIEELPQYAQKKLLLKTIFSGVYGLSAVGPGLSDVLSSLSPEMRARALSELKKQFSAIDLDAEKMASSEFAAKTNELRVHRRNLEVIIHLVLRSELVPVRNAMKSGGIQNTKQALDNYYSLVHKTVGPKRGGYAHDIVLRSAQIVQEHLAPFLGKNQASGPGSGKDEWIDLFGSWTNGKAALQVSDVDMKFSSTLLASIMGRSTWDLQGAPIHLHFAEVVTSEGSRATPRLRSLWQAYQNAENALAQEIFKRRVEKPSELLSALYPPKPYSNDATDLRWYNPLTVRIYRDRIELRLDDLIEGDTVSLVVDESTASNTPAPQEGKGWNWRSLLKWPGK